MTQSRLLRIDVVGFILTVLVVNSSLVVFTPLDSIGVLGGVVTMFVAIVAGIVAVVVARRA